MITLDLTCPCGARLHVALPATYSQTLGRERAAFTDAHAACRENRPLVMWGGDQA